MIEIKPAGWNLDTSKVAHPSVSAISQWLRNPLTSGERMQQQASTTNAACSYRKRQTFSDDIHVYEMCILLYWQMIKCHPFLLKSCNVTVLLVQWGVELNPRQPEDAQSAIINTSNSDIDVSEMCNPTYWPLISYQSHQRLPVTELCCDCSVGPMRWKTHTKASWWYSSCRHGHQHYWYLCVWECIL